MLIDFIDNADGTTTVVDLFSRRELPPGESELMLCFRQLPAYYSSMTPPPRSAEDICRMQEVDRLMSDPQTIKEFRHSEFN